MLCVVLEKFICNTNRYKHLKTNILPKGDALWNGLRSVPGGTANHRMFGPKDKTTQQIVVLRPENGANGAVSVGETLERLFCVRRKGTGCGESLLGYSAAC